MSPRITSLSGVSGAVITYKKMQKAPGVAGSSAEASSCFQNMKTVILTLMTYLQSCLIMCDVFMSDNAP